MFSELMDLFRKHGSELGQLRAAVHTLTRRISEMDTSLQAKIDKLTADVAAMKSAEASAVALLNGLSEQLKAALAAARSTGATDEQLAALDALDGTLASTAGDLAAAVAANTAPVQEPQPAPPGSDSATAAQEPAQASA